MGGLRSRTLHHRGEPVKALPSATSARRTRRACGTSRTTTRRRTGRTPIRRSCCAPPSCPRPQARAAWQALRPRVDLARLDRASLRLLPLLDANLRRHGIDDPLGTRWHWRASGRPRATGPLRGRPPAPRHARGRRHRHSDAQGRRPRRDRLRRPWTAADERPRRARADGSGAGGHRRAGTPGLGSAHRDHAGIHPHAARRRHGRRGRYRQVRPALARVLGVLRARCRRRSLGGERAARFRGRPDPRARAGGPAPARLRQWVAPRAPAESALDPRRPAARRGGRDRLAAPARARPQPGASRCAPERCWRYLRRTFDARVPDEALDGARGGTASPALERLEFRVGNRPQGLLGELPNYWCNYRRLDGGTGMPPLLGFPFYLQQTWRCRVLGETARGALERAGQRRRAVFRPQAER